eukprot:581574_1
MNRSPLGTNTYLTTAMPIIGHTNEVTDHTLNDLHIYSGTQSYQSHCMTCNAMISSILCGVPLRWIVHHLQHVICIYDAVCACICKMSYSIATVMVIIVQSYATSTTNPTMHRSNTP